jgi:hypothetical protein
MRAGRHTQAANGTAQVAVQIAPGVRRIGPPVESFRDYLRRQGQNEAGPRTTQVHRATNTTGPASMYGAVAAAPADDDADEGAWNTGWSDTRFDPSMMPVTRTPAPLAARTCRPPRPPPAASKARPPVARASPRRTSIPGCRTARVPQHPPADAGARGVPPAPVTRGAGHHQHAEPSQAAARPVAPHAVPSVPAASPAAVATRPVMPAAVAPVAVAPAARPRQRRAPRSACRSPMPAARPMRS